MIRRAVIDTGPIFRALAVNHAHRRPVGVARDPVLEYADASVQSPGTHLRFLNLLASIPQKLTTSHVLGEVNGLVNVRLGLREPELGRFWDGSIDLLTQWNLDERLIQFLVFARESGSQIKRVGLVDTGLIRLAQENGCPLITGDEKTLAPLAHEQGVDCHLLRNLL